MVFGGVLQPFRRKGVETKVKSPLFGKYYCLIIVDSYSKWPEVLITEEATANFTERCLRSLLSREGVPQVIVTDYGSHFVAENLEKWLKSMNVTHLTSAPRHPKSNGLAESFVKALKYAISAVDISSRTELERFVNNFLFHYRNCKHSTTKQRPSILFRGEVLRSAHNENDHRSDHRSAKLSHVSVWRL